MGLTSRPIKSKIIFSVRALHFWQTRIYLRSALSEISVSLKFLFFPSETGNFRLFQQARCEVIVKYTNCKLLEHEWTRTGIKTLEPQIDEKNKNIEAQQNVTGSYQKKECMYFLKFPEKLLLTTVNSYMLILYIIAHSKLNISYYRKL